MTNESKQPRQVTLFDVGGKKFSAYAIARLCRASRSTFHRRLHKDGYTVQQAVNELGQMSYERLLEKLT
jgi:hypothetical protein